ncbi:hypothetical protein [Loktanella sp. Alg231-35]|uniref:hypothetical protein n=1 Tax=Loktanella sp. Alg231-35 TaxID=1922220 RepID=UPI000D55C7CA|nr:hypothetical protein [Loktanella sp. Alg231-35]
MEKRIGNVLPLALLISISFAVYSSIDAYLCGCSLLEILWIYSRNGIAAFLAMTIMFSLFRR